MARFSAQGLARVKLTGQPRLQFSSGVQRIPPSSLAVGRIYFLVTIGLNTPSCWPETAFSSKGQPTFYATWPILEVHTRMFGFF